MGPKLDLADHDRVELQSILVTVYSGDTIDGFRDCEVFLDARGCTEIMMRTS